MKQAQVSKGAHLSDTTQVVTASILQIWHDKWWKYAVWGPYFIGNSITCHLGLQFPAFHVKFAKLRPLLNTKSSYASHNLYISTFAVGDQSRLVWFFWRGSWTSACRRLTNIDWGRGRASITYEMIFKITFIYLLKYGFLKKLFLSEWTSDQLNISWTFLSSKLDSPVIKICIGETLTQFKKVPLQYFDYRRI